jgi:septum formation protein
MRPLILASTSPYRRALLRRLGVEFESADPRVKERHQEGEAAAQRARRLALEKANAVAALRPDTVVIGSDQVAAVAGAILDKPGSEARCVAQLERLAGRTATFYTACAVVDAENATVLEYLDETAVSFRTLSRAEIVRYVESERPLDCAGGFKAEGLGIALFERMRTTDPTALIGLPLIWLAGALRRSGYRVP